MNPFVTTIFSKNEADTVKSAENLASLIKDRALIHFNADMGMGKTVFIRGLIRALLHDPKLEVTSPTYPLLQIYEAESKTIFHYDLYRLDNITHEMLDDLSWQEAITSSITLVEWAEKLPVNTAKPDILIEIKNHLTHTDTRTITITHNTKQDL